MKSKKKNDRGPKPKALQVDGDWKDAVKKAVKKKRPPGWEKRKNQLR